MFEIEYNIKIENNVYHQKYPAEKDINNNIFILKGPNDKGKTTTLALLALALTNGDPDKIKNENFKNKLMFLLEKTEFKFNIRLGSYDNSLEIKIDGNNQGVNYQFKDSSMEKLEIVGYPKIEDTIDIIFETPGFPEEKLKNTLHDLKDTFILYEKYCQTYAEQLEKLGEKLKEYNDQETQKQSIKEKIKSIKNTIESYQKEYDIINREFENYSQMFAVYNYNRLKEKFNSLIKEKNELASKKSGLKKYDEKANDTFKKLNEVFDEIKNILFNLRSVLIEYKVLNEDEFKTITEAGGAEIISIKVQDIIYSILTKLEVLKQRVKNRKEELSGDWIKYELLNSLIEVLKNYIKNDPEIPGLQGERASALFDLWIKEKEKLEEKNQEYKALDVVEQEIPKLSSKCEQYKNLVNQYIKIIGKRNIVENDINSQYIDDQLNKINNLIEETRKQLSQAYSEYEKVLDKNISYPPNIEQLYKDKKDKVDNEKEKIDNLNKELEYWERRLEEYNNIKKPDTNLTYEDTQKLFNLSSTLKQTLSKYEDAIRKLIDGKPDLNYLEFYEKLGEYLASVVGKINFEHQEKKVKQINLIKKYYLTDKDEIIYFSQLGAGSTALNALNIRLEQLLAAENNKKYVLLLDEISDIDAKNFEKLLNIIREKTKEGKILLTLMTRPENIEGVICEPIKVSEL